MASGRRFEFFAYGSPAERLTDSAALEGLLPAPSPNGRFVGEFRQIVPSADTSWQYLLRLLTLSRVLST